MHKCDFYDWMGNVCSCDIRAIDICEYQIAKSARCLLYQEREFELLTVSNIIFPIFAYTLSFLGMKVVASLIFELSLILSYSFCIVIPTYLCVKENYFQSQHDSSISTERQSSTAQSDHIPIAEPDSKTRVAFTEHPTVAKLMADPIAHKFLRAYLLDFQDMRMSDYLNFWEQIQEFRKLPKEFLGGKGYLLYQKFLSKDAYRKIDCVTDAMRTPLEATLAKVLEGEEKIEFNFFDVVLDVVEEAMNEKLFVPFFHSKFNDQYKNSSKLKSQMERVQV